MLLISVVSVQAGDPKKRKTETIKQQYFADVTDHGKEEEKYEVEYNINPQDLFKLMNNPNLNILNFTGFDENTTHAMKLLNEKRKRECEKDVISSFSSLNLDSSKENNSKNNRVNLKGKRSKKT